jgi:membrane protein required for colicin V production
MLISTTAGFIRGFTKDFFSTCAWYGSGFIAVFLAPHLTPVINETISDLTLARCAAIGISYLIVLILSLLIISVLSRKVKEGALSGVDRAGGVLFGFVRGVALLVCFCVVALILEIPRHKYPLIENSKILTILFDVFEPWIPETSESNDEKDKKPTIVERVSKKGAKKIGKRKLALEEPPPIEKKETKQEDEANLIKKAKDLVAEMLAKRIIEDDSKSQISEIETPETSAPPADVRPKPVRTVNKPKYAASASLLEARAKRRAERKKKKLKREILKCLDKERP